VSCEGIAPSASPTGDVLPRKLAVDVFLEGHAYASSGDPTAGTARLRVGAVDRSFRISGRRIVEWHRGRPRIGAAAPFERFPFEREHAYGGISLGHPYWRNPGGKGYLVDGDEREGIELPNIEEAGDLVGVDRLLTQPSSWWLGRALRSRRRSCRSTFHASSIWAGPRPSCRLRRIPSSPRSSTVTCPATSR
jgi:hypothetical protein